MVKNLRRGLSPAQIESPLSRMPEPVRPSRETIYTSLYAMPRGQLRTSLMALMRRRHKARKTQSRKSRSNNNSAIPDMTPIDSRPIEIEMRLVPGHWEGDLPVGKGNSSQVGTLVERTTLFVALVKLESAKADVVAEACRVHYLRT